MQTISQLLIAFQKLVRLLQLTLSQSLQVFFLLTPSFLHIAPKKKQNYGKRWSCLCTKLPLPPVISEAYVQGATGVLPPPQWLHDRPQWAILVSGEAILSVENSGKPLDGRGSAPNPTGRSQRSPRPLAGGEGAYCSLSQGAPSFSTFIFHDFSMTKKMKVHDLSAQHIIPGKRYRTYECIRELVNLWKLCRQYHITVHNLTL